MVNTLYGRIKGLCESNNITIAELERALGFSNSTIRKWGNSISPSIDKIIKIAEYFNVSTDYILGATDIKEPINEIITDKDIVTFQRARQNMSDVEKERMMEMLRLAFYNAFLNEDSND